MWGYNLEVHRSGQSIGVETSAVDAGGGGGGMLLAEEAAPPM